MTLSQVFVFGGSFAASFLVAFLVTSSNPTVVPDVTVCSNGTVWPDWWQALNHTYGIVLEPSTFFLYSNASLQERSVFITDNTFFPDSPSGTLFQISYPDGELLEEFEDLETQTPFSCLWVEQDQPNFAFAATQHCTPGLDGDVCFVYFTIEDTFIWGSVDVGTVLPWRAGTNFATGGFVPQGVMKLPFTDYALVSIALDPDTVDTQGHAPCNNFTDCLYRGFTVKLSTDFGTVVESRRIPLLSNAVRLVEARTMLLFNDHTETLFDSYVFFLFSNNLTRIQACPTIGFFDGDDIFSVYVSQTGYNISSFSFEPYGSGRFAVIETSTTTGDKIMVVGTFRLNVMVEENILTIDEDTMEAQRAPWFNGTFTLRDHSLPDPNNTFTVFDC